MIEPHSGVCVCTCRVGSVVALCVYTDLLDMCWAAEFQGQQALLCKGACAANDTVLLTTEPIPVLILLLYEML